MPSPFPGMDPYLEAPQVWPDCHGALVPAMRAQLNARLPPNYFASVEVNVWVQDVRTQERRPALREPDIPVVEAVNRGDNKGSSAAAVAAPATVELPLPKTKRTRYLRIVDANNQRVVTAIELLSPTNKKRGPNRDAYLAKRDQYLAAGVNFVEIDFLRSGTRPPLGSPPACNYYVLVCQADLLPRAGFWPLGVRDRLPEVPVPLAPGDPDCPLDLQACFDRAYDEGRYPLKVNYARPPAPPLRGADAEWARQLLAARSPGTPPGEQR